MEGIHLHVTNADEVSEQVDVIVTPNLIHKYLVHIPYLGVIV
ncbi:unnamed protein product, partial [marine sediment metagenome]